MKTSKLAWLLFVACAAVGCGTDGPVLADVTGTVTLDGKPLQGAVVTFAPEKEGSTSYGMTDAEGNYSLMYSRDKSGAMVGKHNVSVETERLTAEDMAEGVPVPEFVPVPEKYKQPGALTANVEGGDNDIDFDLTSK
jgi:hypothetical protein